MKAKSAQQRRQAKAAAPAPGLDEIITISKQDGKPKLELKKTSTGVEKPKEEPKGQPKVKVKTDIIKGASKKKSTTRRTKFETKMQTRKPKAEPKGAASKAPIEPKPQPRKEKPQPEKSNVDYKPVSVSQDKIALAEAALFLSSKPLMLDELAKIMGVNSLGYVKESLESLKSHYEGRGIEVVSTSSGWRMQVRPGYLNAVAHLAPYADLSEGPKRALALILFKEPMKQSDLIKMQGNKVYDYLKTLEKMGMIRREPCGRTKTLTLTKEFERYFGEEKDKIKEKLAQELENQKPAETANTKAAHRINAKSELKKIAAEMHLEEDVE